MITSVWSSYGHTFMTEGDNEVCLTCGAVYSLVSLGDDDTRGEYIAANGDEPVHCTHNTAMGHGEDADPDSQCNCRLCA